MESEKVRILDRKYHDYREDLSDWVRIIRREIQWGKYLNAMDSNQVDWPEGVNLETLKDQHSARQSFYLQEISRTKQFLDRYINQLQSETGSTVSEPFTDTVLPVGSLDQFSIPESTRLKSFLDKNIPFRPVLEPYGVEPERKFPKIFVPEWLSNTPEFNWIKRTVKSPLFDLRVDTELSTPVYERRRNLFQVPSSCVKKNIIGSRAVTVRFSEHLLDDETLLQQFLEELFRAYYDLYLENGQDTPEGSFLESRLRAQDLFAILGPGFSNRLQIETLANRVGQFGSFLVSEMQKTTDGTLNSDQIGHLKNKIHEMMETSSSVTLSRELHRPDLKELLSEEQQSITYQVSSVEVYDFFVRVIGVRKKIAGERPVNMPGSGENEKKCDLDKDSPKCWLRPGSCPCMFASACEEYGCLGFTQSVTGRTETIVTMRDGNSPVQLAGSAFEEKNGTDGLLVTWLEGMGTQRDSWESGALKARWLKRSGRNSGVFEITSEAACDPVVAWDSSNGLLWVAWVTGDKKENLNTYLKGGKPVATGIRAAAYRPYQQEPEHTLRLRPVPKINIQHPELIERAGDAPLLIWEEFQFDSDGYGRGNLMSGELLTDRKRVGTPKFLINPLPTVRPHRYARRYSARFDDRGNLWVAWGTPRVEGEKTRILRFKNGQVSEKERIPFVDLGEHAGYPSAFIQTGENEMQLFYQDYSQRFLSGSDLFKLILNTKTPALKNRIPVTSGSGHEWAPEVDWIQTGDDSQTGKPLLLWVGQRYHSVRGSVMLDFHGSNSVTPFAPFPVSDDKHTASEPQLFSYSSREKGIAWIEWTHEGSRIRYTELMLK